MTAVTPLPARPFDDSTDSLVRFAMRLDATLSGVLGLLVALLADSLSTLTGVGSLAEFGGGAALVLCGLVVYALTAVPDLRRVAAGVVAGNVVLTVAILAVIVSGALPLTPAGVAAAWATAGCTALMGYLQYLGVRRLPA